MCYHLKALQDHEAMEPDEKALEPWALGVCKASRQANVALWNFRFTESDCRIFRDLLLRLCSRMPDTRAFHLYRRNVLARAASAESYLAGGMPVAPLDSPVEEAELSDAVRSVRENQKRVFENNPPVCVSPATNA